MPEPHDIEACRSVIKDVMADLGAEVTVSTLPLLRPSPYDPNPMSCPHGTVFYTQPTNEQILRWRRDGFR
jgi:hypothetical protein